MEIMFNVLLFCVGCGCGVVAAFLITEIGCCLFCGMRLLWRIRKRTDCFRIGKATFFYIRAILISTALLAVGIWCITYFAPEFMQYGFFAYCVFSILTGVNHWGCTEENLNEFISTIDEFVLPDMDQEAFCVISNALYGKSQLQTKAQTKKRIILAVCAVFVAIASALATYFAVRHEYEDELVICDECERKFNKELDFYDFYDEYSPAYEHLCPACIRDDAMNLMTGRLSICEACGDMYATAKGRIGLCIDCYADKYELCTFCANFAPPELETYDCRYICLDCMRKILSDKGLTDHISRVFK